MITMPSAPKAVEIATPSPNVSKAHSSIHLGLQDSAVICSFSISSLMRKAPRPLHLPPEKKSLQKMQTVIDSPVPVDSPLRALHRGRPTSLLRQPPEGLGSPALGRGQDPKPWCDVSAGRGW